MKTSYLLGIGLAALLGGCRQHQQEAVTGLPFYTTADFTPRWISSSSPGYSTIHAIPPFQFIDQEGNTVTEKTFAGKVYVANFFYTACPGICKQLTTHLGLVQRAFLRDDRVMILSHSVTPESDNVGRLRQYARAFGVLPAKWRLVTGNKEQVYQVARKAYFADEDMGEQRTSNDFLHTENLLLIDAHRRIRGVYKGTSIRAVNDLIADIKMLEAEK